MTQEQDAEQVSRSDSGYESIWVPLGAKAWRGLAVGTCKVLAQLCVWVSLCQQWV